MRMTDTEVKKLVRQARQTKDQRKRNDAYAKLLDYMTPHYKALAKKRYSIDPDEAWSECQMSLMTAVEDYDMKHPFGFFAYLVAKGRLVTLLKYVTSGKRDPNRTFSLNIVTNAGSDTEYELGDILPDRHDYQQQLEDGEVVAAAYDELLPMLTPVEWEAYKAVYLDGACYDDAGRNYKSADNALSRVKQKIKKNWKIGKLKAAVA